MAKRSITKQSMLFLLLLLVSAVAQKGHAAPKCIRSLQTSLQPGAVKPLNFENPNQFFYFINKNGLVKKASVDTLKPTSQYLVNFPNGVTLRRFNHRARQSEDFPAEYGRPGPLKAAFDARLRLERAKLQKRMDEIPPNAYFEYQQGIEDLKTQVLANRGLSLKNIQDLLALQIYFIDHNENPKASRRSNVRYWSAIDYPALQRLEKLKQLDSEKLGTKESYLKISVLGLESLELFRAQTESLLQAFFGENIALDSRSLLEIFKACDEAELDFAYFYTLLNVYYEGQTSLANFKDWSFHAPQTLNEQIQIWQEQGVLLGNASEASKTTEKISKVRTFQMSPDYTQFVFEPFILDLLDIFRAGESAVKQ